MESTELFEYISATKIRIRKLSPFFAALSLYADIDFSNEVQLKPQMVKDNFQSNNLYSTASRRKRWSIFT